MNDTKVANHNVWAAGWDLGDGLFWRNEGGVHATVLTKQPEFGPKGGRRSPGWLTEMHASSLDGINEVLAEYGFEPTPLREDEIKWV